MSLDPEKVFIPSKLCWPEGIDEHIFLEHYWQKKPLLIRQAFPEFSTPLSANELAGLAMEPDTTPRIIHHKDNERYEVEHGPFDEERFGSLQKNNWSLLVTDVEKHYPPIDAYLNPFRFLPSWRIDDLMISYAPDGASVGAHVDEYDVFLLQASGTRHWAIDSRSNTDVSLVQGSTLKILANFNANENYELEPGDILYLPPGVPHHGIAVGEDCTTWSVGFRAPTHAEIMLEFTQMLSTEHEQTRYRDPLLSVSTVGEITSNSIEQFLAVYKSATQISFDTAASLSGRLITQPLFNEVDRDPDDTLIDSSDYWIKHPFSRFAFHSDKSSTTLFADAQAYDCSMALAKTLCKGEIIELQNLNTQDAAVVGQLISDGCMQVAEA